MGRVINTNSPSKRRNAHMRTGAEILRRLSQQAQINNETKDMLATLVYTLREIDRTVEESIVAWEKRGYWKKADDFQQKWWWASQLAPRVQQVLRDENWDDLPTVLMKLVPHYADIQINKYTRDPEDWSGAYNMLMQEKPA